MLIGLLLTFSCGKKNQKYTEERERKYEEIESELYKLVKPVEEIEKVLILFGGFPQRADDIERGDSKNYNEEANWLINLFQNDLGDPESGIENYEAFSPYTSQTNNIENLLSLADLKIRFYTEPDTVWWKENRNNEPNELNAYQIEKLASQLKRRFQNASIEYIATENKGIRANGERHPHSWSIVDKEELLKWMKD